MSSNNNNNEMTAVAMVVAFIGAIVAMVFVFIYVIAAFLALVLTILCLWAWDEPRTLFGQTLTPQEARRFIRNGLIGSVGLPVFVLFGAILIEVPVEDWLWLHLCIAGYTGGSIGMEYLLAEQGDDGGASARVINDTALPPPSPSAPSSEPAQPQAQPFRFASWDEEEDDKP